MGVAGAGRAVSRTLKQSSANTVLAGGSFVFGVGTSMAMGDDMRTAVVREGATSLIQMAHPKAYYAAVFGPMAVRGAVQAAAWHGEQRQWWRKQFGTDNLVGGNFQDTQRAQTMRQAAVQAIQGSKLNARSALGGEARIMNPYATRSR